MPVNIRKKYYGKKEISKKNRTYRFQLDYYHGGKRVRETIRDVEFLPYDTKEIRNSGYPITKLGDVELKGIEQAIGIYQLA